MLERKEQEITVLGNNVPFSKYLIPHRNIFQACNVFSARSENQSAQKENNLAFIKTTFFCAQSISYDKGTA